MRRTARARSAANPAISDPRVLARAAPEARLDALGAGAGGLTTAESAARLQLYGPNEPVRPLSAHPLRTLAAQFTHTLALLLWFAAGLAFASDLKALGGAVVAVVTINGVFAFVQEYRAGHVVAGLMRQVAVQARVARDQAVVTLPAAELVPGDIVFLAAGDVAPADCLLIESDNLSADLSMLTGETIPVARSADAFLAAGAAPHLADIPCFVPAGCAVATGSAKAVVSATGATSSIGAVAALVQGVSRETSNLERQVAGLSRATAVIAVLTGAATLGLAAALTDTAFLDALTFGTGVIVALVPEGLLPTLSVSLAIGARRMAARGAAVRRLSAVEVVGSVTVICTDKTGTLTENSLTVRGAVAADGSGAPSSEMLLAAVLCNDAIESAGAVTGDPLDVALWQWAQRQGVAPRDLRAAHPRMADVPFSARLRYMSVTCVVEGARTVLAKGAPEAILGLAGLAAMPPALDRMMAEATAEGDRVLLLATGPEGGPVSPCGLVRFVDPPRAGVREAMAACREAGIRVVMLTGDHPETARAVARAVGLGGPAIRALEGREVDAMPDAALREFLSHDALIARVDPEQKLRIVRVLQTAGEVVVVTGDGVNDAPALRAADVGVAMGRRGTEVAKQAADVVLADDNFATIIGAIEEGRSIRANIRRFVSYVFTSNVAEMMPFLVYIFLPVPLPLAVIQALAIDIGTDLLPALALGAEPPTARTMQSPPEPPARPLLTRDLGLRTFLFFGLIEAALGLAGFFAYYLVEGWRPGDSFAPFEAVHREAATVTFLAIVGGQVGCLFAQRAGDLAARLDLRTNSWVAWGLAFELAAALVLALVPGVNRVFEMDAVPPAWLLVVPLAAAAFLLADQVRRGLAALRPQPASPPAPADRA